MSVIEYQDADVNLICTRERFVYPVPRHASPSTPTHTQITHTVERFETKPV